MQFVKTNTAILLCVGPFLDKTDGVTSETGSMAASVTTLIAETDAGSAPTIILDNVLGNDATNPVTHITGDDAGYYYLTLTAANLNRLGRAKVCISGPATHCPVFHELTIMPANWYDSNVLGTDFLQVDAAQWLGQTIAAVDTNGYPKVTVKSGSGTGEVSLSSGGVTLSTSGLNAAADAVWDEDITGHRAANAAGAMIQPLHSGACQAGGSGTTVVLASGASSANDYYNGDLLVGWVTADGTNKFADYITAYVGASRTATVTGIPVSPDATYTYVVLPGGTIPGASAPSAAAVADAVWDELISGHTTENSYGGVIGSQIAQVGTLQAGGTTNVTLDSANASASNDVYKYCSLEITSGSGAGQVAFITGYTAASKVVTLNPGFTVDPSTANYVIRKLGIDASTPAAVATAVWAATRSGNATAGSFGEYVNADAVLISGDSTAAANLEAMVDGTGLTLTNVVVPTVTTVGTLTTYTGNTPQTGDTFARVGAPAGASVSADVAAVKVDTAAILVDTGTTLDGKIDTIDTVVDAVKVKTDSLTFTQTGHVDANVQRINDVAVAGDGSTTPWGP